LPIKWGGKNNENVLWKSPLPATAAKAEADANQSSPIVWGDQVYVTSAYWPAGKSHHEFAEQHITCYRLSDGARQWDTAVAHGPWQLGDLRGGYAAPTPTTDGQRLYVAFGSARISALDMQGKELWHRDIIDYKSIDVCFASSPILYRDTVILLTDKNQDKGRLTAYDKASGEIHWEKPRPTIVYGHTTPLLTTIGGKPQMLIASSHVLQAFHPENGELIWWVETVGDVPTPVYHNGLVYTDSGRGSQGIAVDPDGTGDITKTNIKWRVGNIPEALGSAVAFGDSLYRLHTPAVLRCFDMSDGHQRYAERLEGVSTPSSPIVTPQGILYFASAGKSYVVKAGHKLDILATNDLEDPCQAAPAVAQGRLILKGSRYLYCIGKK
jgi:outer membrane protein assembly factor BamB